jgi:tetratricopeptide (TPR) repeat protein
MNWSLSRSSMLAAFAIAVLSSARPVAQRPASASAQQALGRAITLYQTDNETPEAETLFKQVLRSPARTTVDQDTAHYYLGRYYHRNYYMLRQGDALGRAVDNYKSIHNAAESANRASRWYAEARFYKAIAYIEQANWDDADEAIAHIRPSLDGEAELDYIVWSANKKPLNVTVSTADLQQRVRAVFDRFSVKSRKDGAIDRSAVASIFDALHASLLQASTVKRK